MSGAAKRLLDEALSLSPAERRRIGEALLDSVPRVDVRQAWVDEAKRRADDTENGGGELPTLRDALIELRADLHRR